MIGGQKLGNLMARPSQKDLTCVKELLEAGTVAPVIDPWYPLCEAPKAIRYVEEGHARGKVVIAVERNGTN
jgi:NADPH:quinone reductase-like Zn-dependent oxidoreductase